MGCDIHVAIEIRENAKDDWESFCQVHVRGRWYRFFGELAGVRYDPDQVPVAPSRGLPDDRDPFYSRYDETDDDYLGDHSFTWCTPDEWALALRRARLEESSDLPRFQRFLVWLENVLGLDVRKDCSFSRVLEVCRTLERTREVRLLIGFDS